MEELRNMLMKELPFERTNLQRMSSSRRDGAWYLDLSLPGMGVIVEGHEQEDESFIYEVNVFFYNENDNRSCLPDLVTDSVERVVGYVVGSYGRSQMDYTPPLDL